MENAFEYEIELLRKIDEASIRQECFSVQRLTAELRALLAAPVVERQPVAWGCFGVVIGGKLCDFVTLECPSVQSEKAAVDLAEGKGFRLVAGVPLYTTPPELAELQATIARMTVEIEELNRG